MLPGQLFPLPQVNYGVSFRNICMQYVNTILVSQRSKALGPAQAGRDLRDIAVALGRLRFDLLTVLDL